MPGYKPELEREVVQLVSKYLRDLEVANLEAAAGLLISEFDVSTCEREPDDVEWLYIVTWTIPHRGCASSSIRRWKSINRSAWWITMRPLSVTKWRNRQLDREIEIVTTEPFVFVPIDERQSRADSKRDGRSVPQHRSGGRTQTRVHYSHDWDPAKIRWSRVPRNLGALPILGWRQPLAVECVLQNCNLPEVALLLSTALRDVWQLQDHVERWEFLGGSTVPANSRRSFEIDLQLRYQFEDTEVAALTPMRQGNVIHYRDSDVPLRRVKPDVVTIENATVQGGGTYYSTSGLQLLDPGADPRMERSPEVIQDVFGSAHRGSRALVKRLPTYPIRVDEAVSIGGRHDWNWYHWLIEYLGSAILADETIPITVPLVVSDRIPAPGIDALMRVTMRPIRVVPAQCAVRVRLLHCFPPVASLADFYHAQPQARIALDYGLLTRVREALLPDKTHPHVEKRYFVKRNSPHRRLLNQDELVSRAQSMGFEPVLPGSMSLDEQVKVFSNASVIAGASGAHMANYLFLSPDALAVDLVSEANAESLLPASIAGVTGADFRSVVGTPIRGLDQSVSLHGWKHTAFSVRSDDFVNALEDLA